MINSETIKTGGWAAFFLLALFMAFGSLMLGNHWYIYFSLLALMLLWTVYIVYFCESYITYMWSLLASCIGGFTLCACVVAFGLAKGASFDLGPYSFLASLAPAAIVAVVYVVIANTKKVCEPFEYSGNRVQTRRDANAASTVNYSLPVIGGLTTLAAGVFLKWVGLLTSGFVAMFIMTGGSVFMVLYGRHVIRGLRTLRIQERSKSAPYTFMELDEIREARRRWWLGRLFKWVAARRTPSGD